ILLAGKERRIASQRFLQENSQISGKSSVSGEKRLSILRHEEAAGILSGSAKKIYGQRLVAADVQKKGIVNIGRHFTVSKKFSEICRDASAAGVTETTDRTGVIFVPDRSDKDGG